MQTLAGKLEDANRRLAQLSQQIAEVQARRSRRVAHSRAPAPSAAPPVPARRAGAGRRPSPAPAEACRGRPSPADLFARPSADYQRGRFDLARQGFEEYVETYPKTDLSDDALYWAGECWSAQKKPREALAAREAL